MLPVTISGVAKSYDGKVRVLDGIDLAIGGGELFFLLGGSGCGKTTLLRLVGGFLAPDAGAIRFGTATSPAFRSRNAASAWSSSTTRCGRI